MAATLRVSFRQALPGTVLLVLDGPADYDNVDRLRHALASALAGPPVPDTVVVDCSRLGFFSSTGLNEFIRARRSALDAGIDFRLTSPSAQMARVLQITEADSLFHIAPPLPPQ